MKARAFVYDHMLPLQFLPIFLPEQYYHNESNYWKQKY